VPVDPRVVADERERAEQPAGVGLEQRGLAGAQRGVARRGGDRVLDDDQLAARLAVLLEPVGVDEVAAALLGGARDRGLERRVALLAAVSVGWSVDRAASRGSRRMVSRTREAPTEPG
jgi:hypothetical protein